MFLGDRSQVTAEAISSSRVVRISSRLLRGVMEQRPLFAFEVMAALSDQYVQLVQQIEQLRTQSLTQRIADYFLKRVTTTNGSAELALPYEKALIASCLGVKPECFSRALAQLREAGVQVERAIVKISDVRRLLAHANLPEPEVPNLTVAMAGMATQQNFNSTLAAQWRQSIGSGAPISLLLIDIGQPGQIRERRRSRADALAAAVVAIVSKVAQSRDRLMTLCGDAALAVTLPATDRHGAKLLAQKIQHKIATSASIARSNVAGRRLSASIGMATISPTRDDRVEKIVCFADIALYRAKTSNRDRVSAFHDDSFCATAKRSPSAGVRIPIIESSHCSECRRDAPRL